MNEPNPRIGSYIETGFKSYSAHLDDETYSKVLDSVVIACIDIVFLAEGKMLLGKRAWHPQADWWIIGGRMKPGEELGEAAARHTQRELDIELDPNSFAYLTTFSTAWQERRQPPTDHGSHTTSIVLTAELSAEQAAGIKLNEEYSDQKWLSPADILDQPQLHKALHQCALALLKL